VPEETVPEETVPEESGIEERPQSPRALQREAEALRQKVRELEERDRERSDFLERTVYALRFNQFAMDSLTDALYWIKEDARISYVNQAACTMLGYDDDELLALQVYDLDPGQDPDMWPKIWQHVKDERRRTMATRHKAKVGEIIPVEVAANFFEFGGEEYSIAFVRDIRDLNRMESRLRHEELMYSIVLLSVGIS
jgi:PAS domain S-box-containing protein